MCGKFDEIFFIKNVFGEMCGKFDEIFILKTRPRFSFLNVLIILLFFYNFFRRKYFKNVYIGPSTFRACCSSTCREGLDGVH
jgi:hypothetical protein